MKIAKLFQNGHSQAVRLPQEFRLPGKEVYIKKQGNAIILIPKDNPWDSLINSIDKFPADFMNDREQPSVQEREDLF